MRQQPAASALVTFDAQLAKQRQQEELATKFRSKRDVVEYTGPKVKWEDTGLYKAIVRSGQITEELTQLRNLIRKRTDPSYEPGDDDFTVAPAKKFSSKTDYYSLLQIDHLATTKEVKCAYKRLALQLHPDKNRDKKPDKLREMQEEFERIQEAYEILSDRPTRRQYDRARYDEARAKSQGMEAGMYSQGTGTDVSFWGRWAAKRDANAAAAADQNAGARKKLPKAEALVVELWISIDKALRGGLKRREVKRSRIQRSTGGTQGLLKAFHVEVEPGQADGSERRFEGDGHWPDVHHAPGDLLFRFRHKTHTYLRQAPPAGSGDVELVTPLRVRARALDTVLSAWTITFKGHFVLLRFLNPLLALAPAKSCTLQFRIDGEGLPKYGDASQRGALWISVEVHLAEQPLMPSSGNRGSRGALLTRFARSFNRQLHFGAQLRPRRQRHAAATSTAGSVRCFEASSLSARGLAAASSLGVLNLPVLLALWEAPSHMDPVEFTTAAAALGHHAAVDPTRFCWCFSPALRRPALPLAGSLPPAPLADEELASDGEAGEEAGDSELLNFLLRFNLGPPGGFRHLGFAGRRGYAAAHGATKEEAVPEEELELTEIIREGESRLEEEKQKWAAKKKRLATEIKDEEAVLRELLEKDRAREYERIEREMNGLRANFENQTQAEKKWMSNLEVETAWRHKWECVFKPSMVKRESPSESAPPVGRIRFEEVITAKGKPNDENWLPLDGGHWALTWHPKHGQLLKKSFGAAQSRYEDLEKKIGERRKKRNQTFLEYKLKKQEVSEWTIPPEPTKEERVELDDEESAQLHNLLEPILKELRAAKKQLRELRQRRLAAATERREGAASERLLAAVPGSSSCGGFGAHLPPGFQGDPSLPRSRVEVSEPAAASSTGPAKQGQWDACKAEADKAFKAGEWHSAISLYSKALEGGSGALDSRLHATLLSNRALAFAKIDDWRASLRDAADATGRDPGWPRAWLRRATAELRLQQASQALTSLQRGLSACCRGVEGARVGSLADASPPGTSKAAGQFLGLVAECEAALYEGGVRDGSPPSAADRIDHLRREGGRCFEQTAFGLSILNYSRALYHRSMMETREEATILSNRAAAFLRLELPQEALADALGASEKDPRWAKPLVRAAQASLMLQDFKSAYQHFAKALRLDPSYPAALEGVNDCLQRLIRWDYPTAARRWQRFSVDRGREPESLRVWALSDLFFDQQGVPEWCKSLSSSFYRDDVLMLAGNLADQLPQARFALTVLKSKFRRVFFVPGNHDLWVRRATLQSLLKGERVENEFEDLGDSVSKFLELLRVCDELGVETAPAEVAHGVFVAPMFSWYSRDFMPRELRRQKAAEPEEGSKVTIDQWVKWPFPCGSDDAWKFFMRMNEASLRAVMTSKAAYESFSQKRAAVITMTHFLTRSDQDIDWTVPGCWDYAGCAGLDEQIRAAGTSLHIYGHACMGPQLRVVDGLPYVHNYVGTTDKHRPGMAPYCVFDHGEVAPTSQPVIPGAASFQPASRRQDGLSDDLTQRVRLAGG